MAIRQKFEDAFDYVEVQSSYLKRILTQVINQLSRHVNFLEQSFGEIYETRTTHGDAAEITEDGVIKLDSSKLKKHSDQAAQAMIAHELAHYYLEHYKEDTRSIEHDHAADELARKWGFNVDESRRATDSKALQNKQ
ncbi:hypothetical protein C4565_06985 [Candidatus Parcubacteria bacterium]|nr:MAG: hypothetical protein C4565_06985 [Candidatus Parcubacteria bacterium]